MKRDIFIVIMVFEVMAALIAAGLLFSDFGAAIYLVAAAVYAAVLTPFAIKMKKSADESVKRKLRVIMSLIMLVPIAVALIVVALVVIALMITFR